MGNRDRLDPMTMSSMLLRILLAFSLLFCSEASDVDSEHYDGGDGNGLGAAGDEFSPDEPQYRCASLR